jgi:hypothetical protein
MSGGAGFAARRQEVSGFLARPLVASLAVTGKDAP